MPDHLFFLFAICFLLAHQMDAVRCQEWSILPLLNRLEDDAGYLAFVALHIPLYALLLWIPFGGDDLNRTVIIILNLFLVFHAGLHVVLRNLPENRFGSPFSWSLFMGAGVFGAIDLLLRI